MRGLSALEAQVRTVPFTRPIVRFLVISLSFLVRPIVFSILFLFDIALAYGLC
jgi:hypothetical protein